MVPRSALNLIKPIMRSKIIDKPKWNCQTLEFVQNELCEDVAKILEFAGKPPGFWSLQPSSPASNEN